MKFLTLKTIACLILALAMLFSVSCGLLPPAPLLEESAPSDPQRLTVESVQVFYTTEEKDAFAARLTQTVCDICYLSEGLVLSDSQRARVAEYVREEILPIPEAVCVRADELAALLDVVEQTLSGLERGKAPSLGLLCNGYQEGLSVLGSARMGEILYHALLLCLDREIADCDEKYEKYHYAWYLEDGNRYRAQRTSLIETVGKEDFSVMSGFWFFTLSAVSGAVSDEESTTDALLLNDAEILMLLGRQADYFHGRDLSAEQWRITVELLGTWVLSRVQLPEAVPSAPGAVLSALQKDEAYAAQVGMIMPQVLALYASAVSRLSAEDMPILKGTDATARASVICRAVAADEAAFLNVTNALISHASSSDESQAKAIKKLGLTEAYNAYAQTVEPISEQALLEAIRDHAAQGTGDSYAALRDAEERFVFGFLPYVAFALYGV